MKEVVWKPDPVLSEKSNAMAFMRDLGVSGYAEMVQCSNEEPERFHKKFLEHINFQFYQPYTKILDETQGIAWTKWCIGGTTNVVLNAIDRWRNTPVYSKPAIAWEGENGDRRTITYMDLDREVCKLAGGLKSLGLVQGDVIAIYMPNIPEAMTAMLAIAKIGCIVMPLFSGFGADAISSRLAAGEAKALITVDGNERRGKLVGMKAFVDEAAKVSLTLDHIIVLRHTATDVHMEVGRDIWWDVLCKDQKEEMATAEMDAEAPFLLVFTSGTTGKPKGVVHTHIGFPAKCMIDFWLVLDCKAEDRVLWMSDMGWVIGPFLVFGLLTIGATMVLVEGAPDYPDHDRMWRIIAEQNVTYLGVAPTTIRSFMANNSRAFEKYDLSKVRIFLSSGEAWTEDAWWWLFEKIGRTNVPILNFSGGTEMIGIIGSTILLPLKPTSLNCAVPGTGADIVDENGRSVSPGTVGELVQRRPSIGQTRGLWNDKDRYISTYWSTWQDIWHHGDFVSCDEDGHWYVYGRSDDTMKIAGKRTGPSEIETLLMQTDKLKETAVVSVPDLIKGEAIVVVCSLKDDFEKTAELATKLSDAVVQGLGVPFRPKQILFVPDIPKTRNMKIMRRVIRAVLRGNDPGDLSSLVNPETVDALKVSLQKDLIR